RKSFLSPSRQLMILGEGLYYYLWNMRTNTGIDFPFKIEKLCWANQQDSLYIIRRIEKDGIPNWVISLFDVHNDQLTDYTISSNNSSILLDVQICCAPNNQHIALAWTHQGTHLRILDSQLTNSILSLDDMRYFRNLEWSPNSRYLACTRGFDMVVSDGTQVRTLFPDIGWVSKLNWTRRGIIFNGEKGLRMITSKDLSNRFNLDL
ncbi:MAG: hypothetical protein JW779_05530, partial [Candidatus Thorarchaeota archaeon]|nr:hypothetical protein [Candidatus Thorarchaeota archaeon]